jgi:2-keto-myo-inositol isomerase
MPVLQKSSQEPEMKQEYLSRRRFVAASGAALTAALLAGRHANAASNAQSAGARNAGPFRYSLNTSTIRGQKLGLEKEIDVAAQAGYSAMEPWVQTLQEYVKAGGRLRDIRRRVEDRGLTIENAISFSRWVADDDGVRAQAREQLKAEMDLLAQIGGKRIAAPPAGATNEPGLDLMKAAERYRAILELGDQTGVTPILELWGGSRNLHRLGECLFVLAESGHPKACMLGDVYHIYKGGSDFTGLKMFSAAALPVMHMNDYPADPPREKATDRDRVMPGDGIAPLPQILRTLADNHGETVLSLELFSPAYWEKDALEVARTGLAKMKAAVAKALAPA